MAEEEKDCEGTLLGSELNGYFENFNENLFNLESSCMENVETFISEYSHKLPDDKIKTYETAAFLIKKDLSSAAQMIEDDIMRAPDDIHVWCNKLVYHVLKKEDEAANSVQLKVNELIKVDEFMVKARISYAYWLAERGRQKHHYEEAFGIFDEIISNNSYWSNESLKPSLEKAAVLYIKVLVRYPKNVKNRKGPKSAVNDEYIARIVDLLIRVWNSSLPKKNIIVYTWMAEAYDIQEFEPAFSKALKKFSEETKCSDVDHETCLKIVEQYVTQQDDKDYKMLARAGRNRYKYSKRLKQPIESLEKAVDLCEESLKTGNQYFMAVQIAYAVHIRLWAIDYYKSNKASVDAEYIKSENHTGRNIPYFKVLRFLCEGAYSIQVRNSSKRNHLVRAYEILSDVSKHRDFKDISYKSNTEELDRLKILLGKSQ